MSRSIPSWIPVLNRFLFDFCSQFGPAGYEKSSPRCSQSTIFEKSPVHVNIDFWFHFGANVAPFWGPKYTKTHLEINPKRHQQKWSISGSIFWASWLHFEAQVGVILAPFSIKMRRRLGTPPTVLLRWLFFLAFSPSWLHLGAIWAPFGRLWAPSGLDLESFWSHYGAMLARSWAKDRERDRERERERAERNIRKRKIERERETKRKGER